MADSLEFTEEDMWGYDMTTPDDRKNTGPQDKHASGKENLPILTNGLKKEGKIPDKTIKRQRSIAPQEASTSQSDSDSDTQANNRSTSNTFGPVSSHFREGASQSVAINVGDKLMSSHTRRFRDRPEVDKSMQKLGTSMPITIPGMEKAVNSKSMSDRARDFDKLATFVPPHLIEQTDLEPKAASISNASVAKRDRLLQRNKILRRTGFLEAGALEGHKDGGLPELMDPLNRRLMPIQEAKEKPSKESYERQSALSVALGSTPQRRS